MKTSYLFDLDIMRAPTWNEHLAPPQAAAETDDGIRRGITLGFDPGSYAGDHTVIAEWVVNPPVEDVFVRKVMTFFVLVDHDGNVIDVFQTYDDARVEQESDEQIVEVSGDGFVRTAL